VVQTDPDPLGKVKFASSAAEQFAEDNSLTWRNFAESLIQPSSDNGYTKFDVRRVLKEMSQDEEEE
jgi:hypothetical protein